jgi:serine/threonine protein kinase/ABC-type branched-subunit amino acid transport system substrate-binding protein
MSTAADKVVGANELSGKYRFIAEVGHGGMSEVYLTVTRGGLGGFQKLVVIKLLRRDLAEDDEFRGMFLDEARLSARLNHPNVIQTYDVGEDHGRYYIAMEYLEGQTFERVRRTRNAGKLFPLSMQIHMLVQVLSGLHYAHELADYDNTPMSIVHRDVTPSNVFITYDGQVKLVDFGIAKVLDSLNQTRAGVMKGKARYAPPEQITGGAIDRRADVFSAGVMLWEILAGKPIWAGLAESEVVRRVSSGEVPTIPRDTPPALQQICMKAMAFLPADRYPTADALRADLDGYLAQHATPTRERGIGAAVSELFSDERAKIRQLIEAQLKGSRPGGPGLSGSQPLPALHDGLPGQTSSSPYDVSSGSDRVSVPPSVQITYSGPGARAATELHAPFKKRLLLGGGAAAVVAALAIVVVARGHGSPAAITDDSTHGAGAAPPVVTAAKTVERVVPGVTEDTITVGMTAAFSGPSRELGNRMKLGLETAFAAVNDGGGVAGRTLKLLALDDGYEGKRALANVQELISDRHVFAILGNVGTPTAKEALPYVIGKKVLFFGALTGSGILRKDPPDRYVFNYRASYEEETAKMISYLLDVKKVADRGIVVFAQSDAYGDAGYEGATKTLRKRGRNDDVLRVGYERNTVDVDDAVNKIMDYHNATVRVSNDVYRPRHPVKAIIMVGTYKASARFIQKIRDRKLDALVLNVSFVGSSSLAEELKELGPNYGAGVIVTQVVPHFESGATGILRYRELLKKYHPDQQADFVSLEGYVVGQLFAEGLRRTGRALDTEALIDALEQIQSFDPGIGGSLGFGMSQHQASHKVWGTQLDELGSFKSLDMD